MAALEQHHHPCHRFDESWLSGADSCLGHLGHGPAVR